MTEHVERLTREEVMELMDIDPDFVADEFCRLSVELQRLQRQIIAKDEEIDRLKARVPVVCWHCDGTGNDGNPREVDEDGNLTSYYRCLACNGNGAVWKEPNDD